MIRTKVYQQELQNKRYLLFVVFSMLLFVPNKSYAQIIEGNQIPIQLNANNEYSNLFQISKILRLNARADFEDCINNNEIASVISKDYSPSKSKNIRVLIVRLSNHAPSVLQRCLIFFKTENGTVAYASADTILIDNSSNSPFILLTSLKGKFFAQSSTINSKIINEKQFLFWENYKNDECDIYFYNNVNIVYKGKKRQLEIHLKNICGGDGKVKYKSY